MINENGDNVCDLCKKRAASYSSGTSELCMYCAEDAGWLGDDDDDGEWITY